MSVDFMTFVEEQTILFIALAVIVGMLIYSYVGDKLAGFTSVSTDEAVRLFNQDAWLLDVRAATEYKTGFIGEATNISSTEIKSKMTSIMKYKDKPVLVYCLSGGRSAGVAKTLVKEGFTNVNNLKGGIMAWKSASLPLNTPKSVRKQKNSKKNK